MYVDTAARCRLKHIAKISKHPALKIERNQIPRKSSYWTNWNNFFCQILIKFTLIHGPKLFPTTLKVDHNFQQDLTMITRRLLQRNIRQRTL